MCLAGVLLCPESMRGSASSTLRIFKRSVWPSKRSRCPFDISRPKRRFRPSTGILEGDLGHLSLDRQPSFAESLKAEQQATG
ncbi:gp10 [Corynebacterium phage P1201]|uniref:Gp10 n=1 Tax=Corynebacterium phage P1201 TaxID=384848 RepID=A7IY81_9CAUD|nr:gp10 [Corynebacterium phage P1201]ABF57464.1 gp10 [Corynebacterium phage P1201]